MSRILYWNIQQFSINKIANVRDVLASASRLQLIEDILRQSGADIIVVGEVSARGRPEGRLTGAKSYAACRRLLDLLQAADLPGGWRLVPPITVGTAGKAEAVAVFYRGVIAGGGKRIFTGPRRWSSAVPGSPLPQGSAAASGNYPQPERDGFKPFALRTVPANAQHNVGRREDQLAPAIDYYVGALPQDFAGNRPPYCCTFCETNAANVVVANVTVFAVHTSPRVPLAVMTPFAASDAAGGPLGANETRVIVGDFNLNLLTPVCQNAYPYVAFAALGYTPLLDVPALPPAAHERSYRGYVATHIKRRRYAKFLTTAAVQREYPSFGYVGADPRWPNFFSIDNILVRRAAPPVGGYRITIANVVTGTPFTDPFGFNAGGVVVPLGSIAFARQVLPVLPANPPSDTYPWNGAPQNGVAPGFVLGANRAIGSFANYGRIHSTSDHFAVVADV